MSPARSATRPARRPARAPGRRRRWVWIGVAAILGVGLAIGISGIDVQKAIRELTLPLQHDDIIRQQAAEKNLDPAMIAAVIYAESRFRDQESHAGALGLMQITPDTADFIARHSGGYRFKQSDLATPQINIAYGSYYLRYLIDHYGGSETLAVAAYNAGLGTVDRWVEKAGGASEFRSAEHIPVPETRAYVENVMDRRGEYRDNYADDLGL